MWLSKKVAAAELPDARLERGCVTYAGDTLSVNADGEVRGVEVWSPAGFRWKPQTGTDVLVLKSDSGTLALASGPKAAASELVFEVGSARISISEQGIFLSCGSQFINITPGDIISTMKKD